MMSISDYRRLGRESLRGNWLLSILVCFLATLLGGAVGGGSFNLNLNLDTDQLEFLQRYEKLFQILTAYASVSGIVSFLVGGTIALGCCRYFLNQFDRRPLSVGDLFSQFHQFGKGFCLRLLTSIFTALWSLLFVIPGIVASYRYAMAPFIQTENPEYTASEAISASKELMYGHKLDLFLLDLSFIGWSLLCILTLGFGNLFLCPYRAAAYAAFYRNLCPASNIIDAQ